MRAKLLTSSFFLLITISAFSQTATAPSVGDGTSGNPWQIATLDNLYWLTQTSAQWVAGKYFIQTADIDASATSTWFSDGATGYYGFPIIGGSSNAVGNHVNGTFSANYDGQGYKISNLYINRAPHYVGLFGYCSGNTIKNLTLVSPTVIIGATGGASNIGYSGNAIFLASGSNVTLSNIQVLSGTLTANTWHGYIGGMLGRTGAITATNCSVNATMSLTTTYGGNSGGFIGYSESSTSTFTNCYSSGSFSTTTISNCGGFVGSTYAGNYSFLRCGSSVNMNTSNGAGGFAGSIYDQYMTFQNCYATGNVSSASAGGFYSGGYTSGSTLTNCYASGAVSGTNSGGFAYSPYSNVFSNCFWDNQNSGRSNAFGTGTNANVVGKTTSDMKTQATFTNAGWDFLGESTNGTNDYWMMDATGNNGYPFHNSAIRYWTGAVSTDWTTAGNWLYNNLPTTSSIIRIDASATRYPVLAANSTINIFDFNGKSGLVDLGNNNLTCSQILGYKTNSYIKTSGTGKLIISIPTSTLAMFPIGNSTLNTLGIANRTGATDVFSASVSDQVLIGGTSGNPITGASVNCTWDIAKTNANTGSGVDFLYTWNSSQEQGGISTYRLNHYSGTSWGFAAGTSATPVGTTTKIMRHTSYTSTFSPFAIGSSSVTLPVNWLSFNGRLIHGDVELNWSTASELNNSHFEIQRSANAIDFSAIGSVAAGTNPSVVNNYQYLDLNPLSGTSYYRLKQVDIDGKYSFSSIIQINGTPLSEIKIYSDAEALHVLVPATVSGTSIAFIYDAAGRLMQKKQVLPGRNVISTAGLSGGNYFVQLVNGGKNIYSNQFVR